MLLSGCTEVLGREPPSPFPSAVEFLSECVLQGCGGQSSELRLRMPFAKTPRKTWKGVTGLLCSLPNVATLTKSAFHY